MNKRKCKCGYCKRTLEKGEGIFMIGNFSHQKFYICKLGEGCRKESVMQMSKALETCKEAWIPKDSDIVAENGDADTHIVVIQKGRTYNMFRFFILQDFVGNKAWVCSVDVGGVATAGDVISHLLNRHIFKIK